MYHPICARIFRSARLLACVLLLAVVPKAQAQYQVESWTTDNGLPQNTVHSILQTRDGYLWLTTLDGLVRYDGVRFTVFNKNNTKGISSNRFTELMQDATGDLWVGTENSDIIRYHDGSFQTFTIADEVNDQSVWNLALNNEGKLVAFTEAGIVCWDGEKFEPYEPVAGETKDSRVWWSKTGEFWHAYGHTAHRLKDNRVTDFRLPGTWEDCFINNLFEDSRGRMWIGTVNAGLFMLENEKLTAYTVEDGLPSNNISPRIEDRDGNLWAVGIQGAIIIADGKVRRPTTGQGLNDNTLASLYALTAVHQDREGNIWIGSLYRGLNRLSRQSVTFYSKKDGLQADVVHPIYQTEEGDIWVGGSSLTHYEAGHFSRVAGREKFSSEAVTAIYQDRRRRIWFGHWGGVYYLENGEFTDFTHKLGQSIQSTDIHEDRQGNLWFASQSGLFRYRDDAVTRFTTSEGLASNDMKVIHESPDGTLWFGTYGGLTRFKDNSLVSFTAADGLASDRVRSLYEDAEGVMWIGSYDGGLTRFKDGRFTRYTTNDGLFNDGVFQILEDERGNLWMSCNRGIYRVSKQQLNDFADGKITRVASIAYNKSDGLLETECNGGQQPAGIKARDGKLWFPTQRGVAVIDPNAVNTNPLAPPVLLESARIDGVEVALNNGLEIAPGKNNLEIAYAGLSFVKPEYVKFKYKLEGLDTGWVEAEGRRTAYYSYLPPGKYVFRVIAANADGVWNEQGASVIVRVVPPFYQTWLFGISSLLLVAGAAFTLYRRRVVRLEGARKAQEEFSRRLLASQEQERQRIAAELHDSIGQSLLIIKNRAFLALSDLDEPKIVREQLEELSESATGAIEECREISYNLRPYRISRFGLTKTLEAIFRRISEVTDTRPVTELDSIDDVFSAEAETNIYRIVQESVNNIIKHSQASEAKFIIRRRGDAVEMLIQDNGRGFDKNAADSNGDGHGGFGLVGMAERVRILGGVYEVDSSPGTGTSIKVKLIRNRLM